MYRVVEMCGDNEPWWFLEGWQEDIVATVEFENFYEALKFYKHQYQHLAQEFSEFKSQADFLAAFWNKSEIRWCGDCAEYLQQYHGLALLEDWHTVETFQKRLPYIKKSGLDGQKFCQFKRANH
jgi:hypothetical protein